MGRGRARNDESNERECGGGNALDVHLRGLKRISWSAKVAGNRARRPRHGVTRYRTVVQEQGLSSATVDLGVTATAWQHRSDRRDTALLQGGNGGMTSARRRERCVNVRPGALRGRYPAVSLVRLPQASARLRPYDAERDRAMSV